MNNHLSTRTVVFVTLIFFHLLFAVDASPERIQFDQPDGSTFFGHVRGDEWAGWHESDLGFPIVKNQDGWWVYASGVDGNRLIGSGSIVHATDNADNLAASGFSPSLRPQRIHPIVDTPVPNLNAVRSDTFLVPLLLVNFPDYPNQYGDDTFDDIMNSVDTYGHPNHPGSGSFRDFYHEISYDQFDPISTIDGWYTTQHNHDYYGYSNGYDRLLPMIRALVDSAEANGMDWSQFDNDGDGTVDALNIIHAGPGAEQGDHSNIWSHKWSLSAAGLQVQYDGVWINSYTMNPEIQSNNIVAIGVICHEFGHALGLPDLYDTDYSSTGSGKLALMASGSWGTAGNTPWYPSAMNAWCKAELDWVDVMTLNVDQAGVEVEQSYTSNTVFQVDHVTDDSEYWLIENRQKVGTDVNMHRAGLLFWHIDTEKTSSGWRPNNDEPHYGVGLEQADGMYHLENNGGSDSGDPFPGATDNRSFSYNTVPGTESYYFNPSMISMDNISDPDSIMTFDLTFNEYLLATIGVENGSGPANGIGSFELSLENDMVLNMMDFELNFNPDIFDITDVEAIGRATVDSITVSENVFELHNPQIAIGDGGIIRVFVQTNSGTSGSSEVSFDWVHAEDDSGNGIGFYLGTGTYTYTALPQVITVSSDSGTAGSYGKYSVSLSNQIPIKMFLMNIDDSPDYLIPFAEVYDDNNGNGQWDEGESFLDTNQDSMWTPLLEPTDRMAGWNTNVSYTATGIQVAASTTGAMDVGDGPIFFINNVIDDNAIPGDVTIIVTPTVMIDEFGNSELSIDVSPGVFTVLPALGNDHSMTLPEKVSVSSNYPNPFNPSTSLDFTLPEDSRISVKIYDITGKMIFDHEESHSPGRYQFTWYGKDRAGNAVSSGIYYLTFTADGFQKTQKIMLLK